MLDVKTLWRKAILVRGWLSRSITGSPLPKGLDWGSSGSKKLSWSPVVTTRDPGLTSLSLEASKMHTRHLELKPFIALPLVSTGNPHRSAFGGRSYIEGLAGQYVDAPFLSVNRLRNFRHTFCLLESTRRSMCIYPRISCRSYLLDIAEAS